MATTVDELQIEISANATKANQSIDRLVTKLNGLSASLSKLNTNSLTGLANGVNRLGSAMQTMNTVKTSDFTRLANNVQKLGSINVQSLNSAASSMSHLTRAFNNLGSVSANAMQVGELARNISRLGNASVQRAITNIPQLATSLSQLMATLSRAPKVSSNVIQMTQALANLASQGGKVGSTSKSVQNGLNRASTSASNAKKSFSGLAGAIGKFYANYFLVVRGLKGLWKSIEGTADYIEAYNYFDVAMGKIGKDWSHQWEQYAEDIGVNSAKEYAESFRNRLSDSLKNLSGVTLEIDADGKTGLLTESGMKNLGLNIQEVTQYASQLASVTNSVGQTGEVSLATANAFTKLGADMSSLFNVDYSQVMNNLQSGLIGQSRALYKYGIDITNATLQTKAYELGLTKAVSEMTQMEKQQLRVISILEQSKVAWGDLANTINSPSNMIRQLTNNLKEAGMMLGQLFIPMLQKVLPVINGVVIAIKRLLQNIANFFGIELKFSDFSQGFNQMEDSALDMSESLDNVASSAKKAKAGLRGFDELKTISMPDTSSAGGAVGGGGGSIDLTDKILKATEEYNKVWQEAYDKMENRAEKFADKLEKILKPIKKLFKDLFIGDYFAVGEDVSNIISDINNFFAKAISKVNWEKIGRNIGDFLAGINWTKIFNSFGRLFWEAINAVIDIWKGSFKSAPIETTIISAFLGISLLNSAFSGIFKILSKVTKFFTPLITVVSSVGSAFSTLSLIISNLSAPVLVFYGAITALVGGLALVFAKNEEVRKSFFDAISVIGENLKPLLEVVTNEVLPSLKDGWTGLLDILKPFTGFLNTVFVSVWQDVINPALMYIGKKVLPIVIETFRNLWNNILVPLAQFLGSVLGPVIKIVSNVLELLWKNVIVPLANVIKNTLAAAFEGLATIFNKTIIPIVNVVINIFKYLWKNVFNPLIENLDNKFKPHVVSVFSTIKEVVNSLSDVFKGLINFITGVFTLDWEKAWNGIKDIFKGVMNGLISLLESVLNNIIGGINDFFSGFRNAVSDFGDVIGIDIDIPKIPEVDLPRFEQGGFPDKYSLFMAGENGIPELAGTVGGRTAVAGGAEITGIRDAIFSTSMQEIQLMREQNNILRSILEKEVGISSESIFKSVRSSANDYTRRTGKRAFT